MAALASVLVLASLPGVLGHGALTKPMPRLVSSQQYCPWCVGEHQPVTNPAGQVRRDAEPSSPCLGSSPGDAHYTSDRYSSYQAHTAPREASYTAGGTMESRIVLDADHNGDAIFQYCPHSEAQTESCFRERPLSNWEDVHTYWDPTNTDDHWKSGQTFPQTVNLPADMPSGPVSIRWLWICKYTDEIFVSCLDTEIVGGSATTAPATTTTTTSAPSSECIWTEPMVAFQRTPREEKDGRICWDFTVPAGTKVFYKSKTDIYTKWNAETCCLSAANTYGSDSSAAANNTNIVVFTPSVDSFGFCECTAWDPNDPGASCAGDATASNMMCPVLGANGNMCGASITWDGLPVNCGSGPTGTTTAAPTQTTTESTTDGCCYWDVNSGCRGDEFCDASKSNCEVTCNGNWQPATATTTSTTTAPTTTSTTVYTTTAAPTTSTSSSTASELFEPVDGGVDRVCRGASPTDNSESYFRVVYVNSLESCKQHCMATSGCQGIEHINTRCEVWTRAEGIEASAAGTGYTCLRFTGGGSTTSTSTSTPRASSCGQLHDQCGGANYGGSTCCVSGLQCEMRDASYSQCVEDANASPSCAQIWQQCGGKAWTGFHCCVEGLTCVWGNEHYSQCLRLPGSLLEERTQRTRLRKPKQGPKQGPLQPMQSKPWLVQKSSKISAAMVTEEL